VVVAHALREHRQLNAAFLNGELRVYREINVGIATATDKGLMVPVICHADKMSLSQIQERITQLREKAQKSRFTPDEVRSGTFTLSNLGMYGIDAFLAIINPPEAAILAMDHLGDAATTACTFGCPVVCGQEVSRPSPIRLRRYE
jgi:pyruvate dehydrogenase E2 component (dihydrolipoamide acetyltransferase)